MPVAPLVAMPSSVPRSNTSRWAAKVYIPDNARMEIPPEYFLKRLHDQDAELRLLPSRQRPFAYVLARVRRLSAGHIPTELKDTVLNPDTQMCWQHGLVPVCMVFRMPGKGWSPDGLIRSLKARDTWAVGAELGGKDPESRGNKIADMLEQQEAADQAALDAQIRKEQWDRSGEGWRTYQARTGQRVAVAGLGTPRMERRAQSAPSGSTVGLDSSAVS